MNSLKRFCAFGFFLSTLLYSCTKLDTTLLGNDLIPVVDNVNTFADTLDVITSQGIFNDSTKVARSEIHVLGKISGDPVAGETQANIYFQLKPGFYPYYFGERGDTINPALAPGSGFDSAVLCLSYRGFYGDSSIPLNLQVVEVAQNNELWDSVFQVKDINYAPQVTGVLGFKTVDVRAVRNVVKYANGRDSALNQIRIPLNASFASRLFACDTLTNNNFRTDSLFRRFFNGFGVIAQTGRGLMNISISDTNTKLEVHFRRRNRGRIDTVYSTFKLNSFNFVDTAGRVTNRASATANNIIRTRPGLTPGSTEFLLQTQPGTYAEVFVDSLSRLTNRIVHRATLVTEQIPVDAYYDSIFYSPPLVYLDLKDTTATDRWKPVYFDLNPNSLYDPDFKSGLPFFPTGGVDFGYFGGYTRSKTNAQGRKVTYYEFNLTRHVQQIVTKRTPNYRMRISAPYVLSYPQYFASFFTYGNRLAWGRVKLSGGSHPTTPMKMIVIYSKIK